MSLAGPRSPPVAYSGAEVVRGTYGHPVHRDAGAIQQPRDPEIAQLRDDRRGLVCRWGLLWVGAS